MVRKSPAGTVPHHHMLSRSALRRLAQMVERYPYYHAARLIYLRALYQNHDEAFASELGVAALHVPSRRVLYDLIEGERLNPSLAMDPAAGASAASEANDRAEELIDQFLDSLPGERQKAKTKVDASVDYIEYLRQNDEDNTLAPSPEGLAQGASQQQEGGLGVIEQFLDSHGKLTIHERSDEEMLRPEAVDTEGNNSPVLTEVMARIYIKQHKYERAQEIIQKLSLMNPNKNTYFADQLRFLGKLIVNEKTNKTQQ